MVFLENLENHSVREACFGAAAYAAERADLDFEPWPLSGEGAGLPRISDFREADCLIMTERSCSAVFGPRARVTLPHAFILADVGHGSNPAVSLDQHAIGAMAAEHLILRGYRNLAFVGSSEFLWSRGRGEGFARAARLHGIQTIHHAPLKKTLPVYWQSNFSRRDSALLHILRELPKPCGIFAANDVIACFLIETARVHGIRVPQQIGVIGTDDDPVPNATAGMDISSVQAPFREVGWHTAALLDRRCRGQKIKPKLVLPPIRVMPRTSTNAFMVSDALVRKAQAYIEEHRSGPIRVATVVRAIGTTPITLIRHFQRHLKVAPVDYIRTRRIEYARELLREGKLNVEEVAAACGFHSSSYFCKTFRRVTNRRPGDLRGAGASS